MYRIVRKKELNSTVTQMEIQAPLVAAKAKPGQFVILRVSGEGERIPLTIAGCDPFEGTVKIIFQIVGATTALLNAKQEGDCLPDFVGPLGQPTETDGMERVCIIGGGVGCAIALPVAEQFCRLGKEVTAIIGFRSKDLLILEEDFAAVSHSLTVMTDDGSYGAQGNVTAPLKAMLEAGQTFDRIMAFGPLVMMKYVVETACPYGVPVTVSMNPIMIDGTGMCGGCRLTLRQEGKRVTKFACVDGPEFDGYQVDFDDAMMRGRMYGQAERHAYEATCRLLKKGEA